MAMGVRGERGKPKDSMHEGRVTIEGDKTLGKLAKARIVKGERLKGGGTLAARVLKTQGKRHQSV